MQNTNDSDNPLNDAPSQEGRKQCEQKIEDIRLKLVEDRGWSDREASKQASAVWITIYNGVIDRYYEGESRPDEAVKAFEIPQPWGRDVTQPVVDLLLELFRVEKTILEQLIMAMESFGVPVPDEDAEIVKRRYVGQYYGIKLCELYRLAQTRPLTKPELDKLLEAEWKIARDYFILQTLRDQEHCNDVEHVQKMKGRDPDELADLIDGTWVKLRVKLGRNPKPREMAKALGAARIPGEKHKAKIDYLGRKRAPEPSLKIPLPGGKPGRSKVLTAKAFRRRCNDARKAHPEFS